MQSARNTRLKFPANYSAGVVLLAWLFFFNATSPAHATTYMYVTNVLGSVTEKTHSGWIELQSFQHTVTKNIDSPPNSSAITISKSQDRASVNLLGLCHSGSNISTVKIEFNKTVGTKPFGYYTLQLRDALISNYSAVSGGDAPYESFSMVYQRIDWDYVEFSNADAPVMNWSAFWLVLENHGTQRNYPYGLDSDGDGIPDYVDPDNDNDGMPDYWEENYGFNPLANDANGDPDDDGLTNLQEYIMGTNPLVPNFRVTSIQMTPTTTQLTWTSKPGKTYLIKGCPTVDGSYVTVTNVPSAGYGKTSTTILRPAGNRFFFVIEQ